MDDADASSASSFYFRNQTQTLNELMFTTNLNPNNPSSAYAAAGGEPPAGPIMFPHSAAGRASAAPEPVKRKRGRPRKYGSLPSSSLSPSSPPPRSSSPPRKKAHPAVSSKKAQLAALGNAGQGFMPYVITVADGEDVAEKIMSFIHTSERAVCILSASGSVSNASLCQSAILGGNVTYEGKFEILSLSGSFLHLETGGASSTRPGGLKICLSGADGRMVGGGVGGPLIAAGPVQVTVGSFLIDPDKHTSGSSGMGNSGSKLSAPVLAGNTLMSPVSLRSHQESSGRVTPSEGSDDHPSFGGGGSSYVFNSQGMPVMPSRFPMDWRGRHDPEHGGSYSSPNDDDEGNFGD